MIVAAAIMAWCDWVLFLLIAAIAPFLWWLNYYFRRRLSAVHRAVQESFSRITATLAESVNGIRVTQGFARERINADLFGELAADHATFNLDVAKASGLFIPLLEFNNQLFIACLLLAGGWRVLCGYTAIADLYQFIMMSGLFFQGVVSIGTQYNNALSSMAGAERVFRLLDSRPGWEDPPDATPAVLFGRVEFRNVSFAYVADRPVLRDVSFTAEPGQTVAIVGHTGSGKTTIINLVAKFFLPTCGDLLLDGRDIRTITSESIHRQTALVLQQNFLFTGTVMENIRLGRIGATDADVIASLRRLRCLDLVEALPNGLQTSVGEKGVGISLGQRQIICFARAMLVDPAILILDEATSAIDTVTERRIQDALAILLRDRTSFVVAHRLSTVRNADHVVVLERGAIIERGTHDTLLARNGVYANLYRQFVRSNSFT
jgi:ATP-binding cassette subfamily B protein